MGFIADNYDIKLTTPLMTDRYHFTTAYGYWLEGRADNPSVFYMFGRKEALNGGYTVAGGLEGVIDIVQRWQKHGFLDQDIAFLRAQKTSDGKQQFPEGFLDYLQKMKFKLKIDAAPEGSIFFPQEPVLRVEGPIVQVKMLESVALCLINGHSGYVTQAARQNDVITSDLENGSPKGSASVQGLRRGPGLGAALEASRSLGFGGYASSSTGTAAKAFGQVFAGTMDHAWVMTHQKELSDIPLSGLIKLQDQGKTDDLREALSKDAFRSFAFAHRESGIFLVDTYDPEQGLENAITVIKELRSLGLGAHYGVRFDSGDIVKYSKLALRRFGEEGFIEGLDRKVAEKASDAELLKYSDKCSVFCSAADGIDEHAAKEMRNNGAFFKSWGIGTAGSHVAPLGLVYKASSVYMDVLKGQQTSAMTPVMKVASNAPVKSSNPGKINSRRYYTDKGKLSHVVIYDENLGLSKDGKTINLRNFDDQQTTNKTLGTAELLVPIFDQNGQYVYQKPSKHEAFLGSGILTTDLSATAKKIRAQLDTLPDAARQVVKSRDDILKKELLALFNTAKKSGTAQITISIDELEAKLPPAVGHIPVFLDMNLFTQRKACEQKHLGHSNNQGIASYQERFESPAEPLKRGLK